MIRNRYNHAPHLIQDTIYKSPNFDHNFMKLCHIVQYRNVFFKIDNGRFRTMPSRGIVLCLSKYVIYGLCENMWFLHNRGHPCLSDIFYFFLMQITWDGPLYYTEVSQVIISNQYNCILSLNLAHSVNPNEKPHNVAFHLSQHCLPKYASTCIRIHYMC